MTTFIALIDNLFGSAVIVPGTPTAGEDFNITCRLDGVVERLVVGRVYIFFAGALKHVQTPTGGPVILLQQFTPVTTFAAAIYICAVYVITPFGVFFSIQAEENY